MSQSPDQLSPLLLQGAVAAAKGLIGWRLYVQEDDGSKTGGMIVETEAYTQEDAASHSYRGRTPRTDIMFGPASHVYVYFTYGMHWCMNIVTGPEGHGEAVLIRALHLDSGLDHIQERRGNKPQSQLADGPAKLCQALAITGDDNGATINSSRILLLPPQQPALEIIATERIGITKDTHRLWRFIAK
jgi:DNA-3-methyladenine glycosylase